MENRKELSEKSKKLIAKNFNSDILNKSTGYYRKENIYPISSKPNELKIKLEKFVPHFKEEKAVERHFNNNLSEKQRNNSFILKYKKLLPYKDEELETERKRNKTIKDNCYDKKGKFSSRRRYILEFYGIEKLNSINKEEEKEEKNNKNNNLKRNKLRELMLKSRNLYNNNYDNENDSIIKTNNEEKFNTVNNNIENNSFFNNFNDNKYNKITRNKIQQDNNISSYTNTEIYQNTINNIIKPKKIFNRLRTDIHYPGEYLNKTQSYELKNFFHSKDITKLFYTKSNNPVNLRTKNKEINNEDKEHYNLEFKLKNNDIKLLDNLTVKNIKEIFYRNGLHVYNINEDGTNILSIKKKMGAKLRKKINDENFENNYKKVIKIFGQKGIIVDIEKISNEKGFQNIMVKKRKGTPGKVLYDNRFHKDKNTKLNTGNKNYFKKKEKNSLPQYDINYKNYFKYKLKQLKK